jgi:hypothetical protein
VPRLSVVKIELNGCDVETAAWVIKSTSWALKASRNSQGRMPGAAGTHLQGSLNPSTRQGLHKMGTFFAKRHQEGIEQGVRKRRDHVTPALSAQKERGSRRRNGERGQRAPIDLGSTPQGQWRVRQNWTGSEWSRRRSRQRTEGGVKNRVLREASLASLQARQFGAQGP